MEARFILLHPDDPGEILLATPLIRCILSQVENSSVCSVVKESHQWLLDNNPRLEEVFVYHDKPGELLDTLKDFLPDYLIDLDGSREVRRFKNRLKVLDFTLKRLWIADQWTQRAFATVKLFDVQDDGQGMEFQAEQLDPGLLPSDFLSGFLVLSLDTTLKARPWSDQEIIDMVVLTEKPVVVTGQAGNRKLADRICQASGCAVFPTCGDLTPRQSAALINHANGLIHFDSFSGQLARAMHRENYFVEGKPDADKIKNIALWGRSLFKSNHERHTN